VWGTQVVGRICRGAITERINYKLAETNVMLPDEGAKGAYHT